MSGRGLRLAIGVVGSVWALTAIGLSFQSGQTPSAGLLYLAIGLTYLYGGLAIWDHEPGEPDRRPDDGGRARLVHLSVRPLRDPD